MPESANGGNQKMDGPPKQMSMEVRLLLAFLLMGVVMFVTPYIFKTPPPANKADSQKAEQKQETPQPSTLEMTATKANGTYRLLVNIGIVSSFRASLHQAPCRPRRIDQILLKPLVDKPLRTRLKIRLRRKVRLTTQMRNDMV